jgi:hypothetical protein
MVGSSSSTSSFSLCFFFLFRGGYIVDLFYMKTCSFRNVQPHESQNHLFCLTDPVACHEMTACGNCGLCYPKYDVKKRRQPSVDFGLATRRHQFVNKYETILNCPCVSDDIASVPSRSSR